VAAPYLFVVRANVTPDQEAAFNAWYDREHVHDVAKLPGCIGGTRYRVLDGLEGDTSFTYLALYEFDSEESIRSAANSEYFQDLIREFNAQFGQHTNRVRSFYGQIYPRV
jgi:antibiotic biosynthesis monooxygenase (ABM) superfamily enzyme